MQVLESMTYLKTSSHLTTVYQYEQNCLENLNQQLH